MNCFDLWTPYGKAESWKFDSELPIRIATYQSFAATLESHDSHRTVLNRPILDSESLIQRHYPDLPILAFFVFLAFSCFAVLLVFFVRFCSLSLSSSRIQWALQRGKPLLFSGDPCVFATKQGLEGQGKAATFAIAKL